MNAAPEKLKAIELILKGRIGLEPSSLGPNAVECAVFERMRLLGLKNLPDYAATLSESSGELEALIELVVVPETWFFRDREPFAFLANFLVSEYMPANRKALRILSAPCASGEEPYSIAMTCLDCGLKENRFHIDAADINARSLGKAERAVYGGNSFRGADLAFRDRHFTCNGKQYTLKPDVRERVRFFKANILDDDFLRDAPPYDFVFCRNLLIYLHDQARAKTIAALDRLLATGGLLFIGHAETNCVLLKRYEAVNHQGAFALRKGDSKPIKPPAAEPGAGAFFAPAPAGNASARATSKSDATSFPTGAPTPFVHPNDVDTPPTIERATRLANEGKLREAAVICRQALLSDKGNAQGHFLMGLIEEAQGENSAAAECFNRAIYLETGFSDAILHLAVLKEQIGDAAAAELLRRRAASLKPQGALDK